ncbi:MAG: arsenate reductase (glutaredoxin) [Chitinophagales bacterium]|nr:arsenate reductase (glutaredoxin) [Chitinophagales bacterium]
MIQILHNNRCGKSRTALQILEEKSIPFEVIEYLKNPLTEKEIKTLLKKLQLQPIDMMRTKESIFKELFDNTTPSDEQLIQAMVAHPILIERPIVINGDKAIIARPPELALEVI